jgi:hypothetical protein
LVLQVSSGGELSMNQNAVEKSALAIRLSQIYRTRDDAILYLNADENASYQQVIDVIDVVQQLRKPAPRIDVPIPEELRTRRPDVPAIEIRLVTRGVVNNPCPEFTIR